MIKSFVNLLLTPVWVLFFVLMFLLIELVNTDFAQDDTYEIF